MFDYIRNWDRVADSYGFSGPDGETSVNEAMLLAAGLRFRIRRLGDCPKRFSPPMAAYARGLHEKMPCKLRHGLFPLMMKLPGSADRPDIEEKRIEFIWVETMHRIMGPLAKMARRFYGELWKDCMAVKDLDDVTRVSRSIRMVDGNLRYAAKYAMDGPGSTWEERVVQIYRAAECAHWSARAVTAIHQPKVWNAAFSILDEGIMLGNHETIEPSVAIHRLEAAKQRLADA